MDYQLISQLQQTIYVATPGATRNAAGEITYGSPASRSARYEDGPVSRYRKEMGEVQVFDAMVVVETEIGPRDRVWPPGADQTDATLALLPKMRVKRVDEYGDTSHWEIFLTADGGDR